MPAIILNEDNFDKEVLKSEVPVVVEFWAPWCSQCKMLAPIMDQLAAQYEGRVKIAQLDIDACQSIGWQYSIMSVPTIMIFKGGQVVKPGVGLMPKPKLTAMIDSILS